MISPQEFDRLRRDVEESKSEQDRIEGAIAEFKKKVKEEHGTTERAKLEEILRKRKAKLKQLEEEFIPLKKKFEEARQGRIEND